MSGSALETAVFGDGVLTFPEPKSESKTMATDVPDNVAQANMTIIASNLTMGTNRFNGSMDAVMAAIAGTVQSNFSEVGVLEGRAVSGVNGTALAGPTNKPAG